jgi:hypothetical protein
MIKKYINFYKIFLIVIYCSTACGFTLLGSATWNVSTADPTIWVKPCASILTNTFTNNLNSTSDELASSTNITGVQAMDSIYHDYINVNSAYIRLAAYPTDPNNPGSAIAGDTTFTIAKASERTIDLCFSSPGALKGGYAAPKASNGKLTSCSIVIKDTYKSDFKAFLATATHEIGHCLGLDHPMETTQAIMSYFIDPKYFRLMIDDRMGMIFLYPNAGVDTHEVNTFGLSCVRK